MHLSSSRRALWLVIALTLAAAIACDRDENKATKYETVDASAYADDCRAFLIDCLGTTDEDADASCSWIDDADEVPECARDALREMLDCFEAGVTCGEYTQEDVDAMEACQAAFEAAMVDCYET
jgi:hypothetical protein